MVQTDTSTLTIRGTTIADLDNIQELVAGYTWMDDQMITMAFLYGGAWSKVLRIDGAIVGALAATPGIFPVPAEPDEDHDANFTDEGEWVDTVDPSARLVMREIPSPVFEQPSQLMIWDIVSENDTYDEMMLQLIMDDATRHGFHELMWVERSETSSWTDMIRQDIFHRVGGYMATEPDHDLGFGELTCWGGFSVAS